MSTSNPQLSPSTSLLRVHVLSLVPTNLRQAFDNQEINMKNICSVPIKWLLLCVKTRKGDMKYYSQYHIHDLFELQESLSLGIEQVQALGQACRPPSLGQDRKRIQQASEEQPLRSRQQARMVVDALIVKHVENLSNDRHAEEKRRALCERNEIEATFGTSKRVYRANDIRAKLEIRLTRG